MRTTPSNSLESKQRQRQVKHVLVVTLVLNLVIAFAKLIYGYISGSMSILADGFHSLMDGTSNVIGLIAIRFSYAPPDEEHHYGHRKAEILASMMISILLGITCLEILKELFNRAFSPNHPQINSMGFGIMLTGLVINLIVVAYESKWAKKLKSQLLEADTAHTRSDVFVTISVMGSMVAIYFQYFWIDSLVSLGIVLLIARTAYHLFRKNMDILLDRSPLDRQAIADLVNQQTGVSNCHKIRAHGSPDDIYLEFHIWVDPDLSIREAHDLAHDVKSVLMARRQELTDVTIHIEPNEIATPHLNQS